jgi:hypothetical protein
MNEKKASEEKSGIMTYYRSLDNPSLRHTCLFNTIGNHLAWSIRDGHLAFIGRDAIIGLGQRVHCPPMLIKILNEATYRWKLGWMSTSKIRLEEKFHGHWNIFI